MGTTSESEFGASVALAPTGQVAVIGGPIDSTGGVLDAGAFWVYVNPASGEPGREAAPPPAGPPLACACEAIRPSRPILSNVSQSRSRWRAGGAMARLSTSLDSGSALAAKSKPKAKVRRAPLGTTFSFTLDVAASVKLTFTRRVAGRKVEGRCIAQNAKNRHKPLCKRAISPLAFPVSAKAGARELAFQGTAAGKKLSPGTYTVTFVATSAGLSSTPKSLSFTIVR